MKTLKIILTIVAAVLTGLLGTFLSMPAANAAAAADTAFAAGNEQVNLAEITIGNIALQRGSSPAVHELATKTIADHQAAQAKLKAAAAKEKITLPSAPNAQQQAQAASLKSVPAAQFDLQYLQIQVAGHQLSIAATRSELADGKDATIMAYARGYLPVASMHLAMSQQDLAMLGGTPTAAPAGTGGQAAHLDTGSSTWRWAMAGLGGLLLLGSGFVFSHRGKLAVGRPAR